MLKKVLRSDKKDLGEKKPDCSILVSVFNHEALIDNLDQTLHEIFAEYSGRMEIIYIDDGSTDLSWSQLRQVAEKRADVKLVKLRTRFGEASALDAGLQVAQGEKILYFTCRVHINPVNLLSLVQQLDSGYDLVIGYRHPRRDSRLNQWISGVFNAITNHFTGLKLKDINSGVMAVKRMVLESIPFYGNLNAFLPVMAARQGFKISEQQIEQLEGNFQKSLHPRDYIRRLLDLISVLFLRNYTKKPLHFLGFVGALFFIVGAIINLYLFVYRILGYGGIAGKPMLLLGTLLFIIGIQMISIGLLGEMIIFTHAKEIQDYNIEQVIE